MKERNVMYSSVHFAKVKKALVILVVLSVLVSTASAFSGSVWRPISRSCPYGAQVAVSAAGNVTATFYYWWAFWRLSYSTVVNFGGGTSKSIITGFNAPYDGVSVSGSNLFSVGGAGCR
jgi:hypothetical protein